MFVFFFFSQDIFSYDQKEQNCLSRFPPPPTNESNEIKENKIQNEKW